MRRKVKKRREQKGIKRSPRKEGQKIRRRRGNRRKRKVPRENETRMSRDFVTL